VDCVEVTELLLAEEVAQDPEVDRHVAQCASCAQMARGVVRLNSVLSSTLLIAPPVELQQRLQQLAAEAARPARVPWWQSLASFDFTGWLAQRPQMIAAQGLAAVMLALASWQIFGWLSAIQPVVGDVAYAVELVAASPAVAYLGSMQIDFQSLGIWSVVGIAGWLVSENGVIGRRIASSGLRLP
jgi:hypothetical protein